MTSNESTIEAIDCSGFVRLIVMHAAKAASSALEIPEGSVQQHEWVQAHGFKKSTFDAGHLKDGVIRIAFLSPNDTSEGIGHVMLLPGDGLTAESHGGKGPDRRVWGSEAFMSKCSVYVLTPAA